MNRKQGMKLSHGDHHSICPSEWRRTPLITGDYDFDETLLHRNVPSRICLYLKQGKGAYGPKTGYNALHGYSGDD